MLDTTLFQHFPPKPYLPMVQATNIELIFMDNKYRLFRPGISVGVLCASREAAGESHF